MTDRDNELLGNLPLQYFDGPDYCTVKDATGGDFALTVQPDLLRLMENALRASASSASGVREALEDLDCMHVNGERYPFGGVPADPETSIRRETIKECIRVTESVSEIWCRLAGRAIDALDAISCWEPQNINGEDADAIIGFAEETARSLRLDYPKAALASPGDRWRTDMKNAPFGLERSGLQTNPPAPKPDVEGW